MIKLSNECVSKCLLGNIGSVHGDGRNFLGHFKRHFSLVTNSIRITQTGSYIANEANICNKSVSESSVHDRLFCHQYSHREACTVNRKLIQIKPVKGAHTPTENSESHRWCGKTHFWLQILGLSSSVIWPCLNDSDGICDIKSVSPFKMPQEYMFRPPPWILPPFVLSKTNRIETAYHGEALVHIGEGLSKISCPVVTAWSGEQWESRLHQLAPTVSQYWSLPPLIR